MSEKRQQTLEELGEDLEFYLDMRAKLRIGTTRGPQPRESPIVYPSNPYPFGRRNTDQLERAGSSENTASSGSVPVTPRDSKVVDKSAADAEAAEGLRILAGMQVMLATPNAPIQASPIMYPNIPFPFGRGRNNPARPGTAETPATGERRQRNRAVNRQPVNRRLDYVIYDENENTQSENQQN